ncbi:MAG: hypothetical protein JRI50_10330 [Deltaproteobacteria bacterium]|nr:hypothetical protein [Deltaproteobacteria bacterium]MBW1987597.1 hypothetical protein [Deltaproteobacteria bacterium]MBW2135804.1 hypothetical protein [Deltaproteobacteria bacterium]
MREKIKQEGRLVHQNYKTSMWAWGRVQMVQSWHPPYETALFYPSGKRVEVQGESRGN